MTGTTTAPAATSPEAERLHVDHAVAKRLAAGPARAGSTPAFATASSSWTSARRTSRVTSRCCCAPRTLPWLRVSARGHFIRRGCRDHAPG